MSERDTYVSELVPEDERTPLESPYSLKEVMRKLDTIGKAIGSVADDQSASRVMLESLTREVSHLSSRVTALELSSRWVPLVLSSLAVAISIWSALRVHG